MDMGGDRLEAKIGNPAFLVGLGICLVAAAWLGVRGALVVIACVGCRPVAQGGTRKQYMAEQPEKLLAGAHPR